VQPSFFRIAATSKSAGAAAGRAAGAGVGGGAAGFAEAADEALGASEEPDFPHPNAVSPTRTSEKGAVFRTGGSLQRPPGCSKSRHA